jgi:hypothetical protein
MNLSITKERGYINLNATIKIPCSNSEFENLMDFHATPAGNGRKSVTAEITSDRGETMTLEFVINEGYYV